MKNFICINFVWSIAILTLTVILIAENIFLVLWWNISPMFIWIRLWLGSSVMKDKLSLRTEQLNYIYSRMQNMFRIIVKLYKGMFSFIKKKYACFSKQNYDDIHVINFLYIFIFSITFFIQVLTECKQNNQWVAINIEKMLIREMLLIFWLILPHIQSNTLYTFFLLLFIGTGGNVSLCPLKTPLARKSSLILLFMINVILGLLPYSPAWRRNPLVKEDR